MKIVVSSVLIAIGLFALSFWIVGMYGRGTGIFWQNDADDNDAIQHIVKMHN